MYIMIDVETAGFQSPAQDGSHMTEFAAIVINMNRYRHETSIPFHAYHGIFSEEKFKERYPEWDFYTYRSLDRQDLLIDICGHEESFVLLDFENWLKEYGGERLLFISDNNGFDFSWMSFYFWKHLGRNPFGHSSTNLGSLYKGMVKNVRKNFKHLRETKHTHHPIDDAMGNVEAFLFMVDNMNLKGNE